jgi:uncharacterized delta-60 repeat protein
MTIDPTQLVLVPGASVDVTVVLTRPADLVEPLRLEITKLPPNAAATTGVIPGDRTRASFRLTLASNTPQGSYVPDVTVRGTSKFVTTRLPLTVIGAPGAIDTTFGAGGHAIAPTEFTTANLGVQPDGHIVLGGTAGVSPSHDYVAVRFDAAGVADAAFGTGGKAVHDFGGDDYAQDAIVQHDGKIVLAGYQYTAVAYAELVGRFNADGTPDTTFGGAATGRLSLSPSTYNIFYGLHQQPDGKLLGGGIRHNGTDYDFTVTRLTSLGELDPSFGSGGYGVIDMGSQDYCLGLATDAQGRVVATGERYNGTGYDLVAARFTAAGVADATFATPSGWVSSVAGGALTSFGGATLVQPDGKVVVGGSGPGPSAGQDFVLFRYNDDGTPDAAFGTGGKAAFDVGGWDRIFRLAIDAQKRILFVGQSENDETSRAIVGRLLPDGQLDASFGAGGRVALDFTPAGGDFAKGLALLDDGRVLVGGYASEAGKVTPWVTRLWP